MMRVKDKGDLYVHQDATWNVIALTDLGGSVVERYIYTPYGEIIVHQETSYGDLSGVRGRNRQTIQPTRVSARQHTRWTSGASVGSTRPSGSNRSPRPSTQALFGSSCQRRMSACVQLFAT